MALYKQAQANEAKPHWIQGNANVGGLIIGNSTGTTTTYAANSLVR
jgi:hypothetical protein